VRVLMLEYAPVVGPELGAGPRPVIEEALREVGVETFTSSGVAAIEADGVVIADGRRFYAATVIWTAGMRANPLAEQIGGEVDRFGRVHADPYLRARRRRHLCQRRRGARRHRQRGQCGRVAAFALARPDHVIVP